MDLFQDRVDESKSSLVDVSRKNIFYEDLEDEEEEEEPAVTVTLSFADIMKLSKAPKAQPEKPRMKATNSNKQPEKTAKRSDFSAVNKIREEREERMSKIKETLAKLRFEIRSVEHSKNLVQDCCGQLLDTIQQRKDRVQQMIEEAKTLITQ